MHGLPTITEKETPTHKNNSGSSTHHIFRWNRKQYHSHLGKLNRNTLTELNRVISTGLFIKMLKIVFN